MKIGVVSLKDNKNSWIIGTPPSISNDSESFSKSIQIKYVFQPDKQNFLKREKYHSHTDDIEECYFVISGWIRINVEKQLFTVTENQIIRVPSNHCHAILDFSDDVEYLTIRAPISNANTKKECS